MANKISIKKTLKNVMSHLKGDRKQWKKQEKTAKREGKSDTNLIKKLKKVF